MILTPESKLQLTKNRSIFLAGAIDLGKAVDWQSELGQLLSDNGWMVFNPRRTEWLDDPAVLTAQIDWELERIKEADLVIFYFPATSKAPISLLELGLTLGLGKKIIVCCEKEYYRYANVFQTFWTFRNHARFINIYSELERLCNTPMESIVWDF